MTPQIEKKKIEWNGLSALTRYYSVGSLLLLILIIFTWNEYSDREVIQYAACFIDGFFFGLALHTGYRTHKTEVKIREMEIFEKSRIERLRLIKNKYHSRA